jgi:hypothetical protein
MPILEFNIEAKAKELSGIGFKILSAPLARERWIAGNNIYYKGGPNHEYYGLGWEPFPTFTPKGPCSENLFDNMVHFLVFAEKV